MILITTSGKFESLAVTSRRQLEEMMGGKLLIRDMIPNNNKKMIIVDDESLPRNDRASKLLGTQVKGDAIIGSNDDISKITDFV